MLSQLKIESLALLDTINLQFGTGLHVFTGETGSGKSLIFRALDLLMGAKAHPEYIRHGKEKLTIIATFDHLQGPELVQLCEELGISWNPGEPLILKREADLQGRTKAWINNEAVSTQTLRRLGPQLINLSGQNDQIYLVDPAKQSLLIDKLLPEPQVLNAYLELWSELKEQLRLLEYTWEEAKNFDKERDWVLERLKTLEEFGLDPSEYRDLEADLEGNHSTLEELKGLLELEGLLALRFPDGRNILEGTSIVARHLQRSLNSEDSLRILAKLDAVSSQLEELSYETAKLSTQLKKNQAGIKSKSERLKAYQGLMRLYRMTDIDSLLQLFLKLKAQRDRGASLQPEYESLAFSFAKSLAELKNRANHLTEARVKIGESLKSQLEGELGLLGMEGARIKISLSAWQGQDFGNQELAAELSMLIGPEALKIWQGLGPKGQDRLELQMSANPGEPYFPLKAAASGGELSRVLLALKTLTQPKESNPTLVFDEIDAGISGHTADQVGAQLQRIAQKEQVLVISHLAQVSAFATHHFRVEKKQKANRTYSEISKLSLSESTAELARLLSGDHVADPSLSNAKYLIKRARSPSQPKI